MAKALFELNASEAITATENDDILDLDTKDSASFIERSERRTHYLKK